MDDSKIFFEGLLQKTEVEFLNSKIHQLQTERGENWSYAICDTPIVRGKGIIFGINWGGNGNFEPQKEVPDGLEITSYRFIKRSKVFLEKGWELDFTNLNFNYSNLCFFRSPKASDLQLKDFRLSLPLFEEYVKYIQPPWLLSIGGTNIEVLNKFESLVDSIEPIPDSEGKFKGYSAKLWGFNLYSVPHPSARLKKVSRETIWEKVTTQMRLKTGTISL